MFSGSRNFTLVIFTTSSTARSSRYAKQVRLVHQNLYTTTVGSDLDERIFTVRRLKTILVTSQRENLFGKGLRHKPFKTDLDKGIFTVLKPTQTDLDLKIHTVWHKTNLVRHGQANLRCHACIRPTGGVKNCSSPQHGGQLAEHCDLYRHSTGVKTLLTPCMLGVLV